VIRRQAQVRKSGVPAGILQELEDGSFRFEYFGDYRGAPISLTMPSQQREWHWTGFPPFFDGLLPEGTQLDALLKIKKIDRTDYFGQLMAVGADLVGDVVVEPIEP
jgi:serine/threonine-protein kinase HipA